jgi:molybdopterin-binding protein
MNPIGPVVKIIIDAGFTIVATILHDSADEMGIEPGMQMFASFKATAVHCTKGGREGGGDNTGYNRTGYSDITE